MIKSLNVPAPAESSSATGNCRRSVKPIKPFISHLNTSLSGLRPSSALFFLQKFRRPFPLQRRRSCEVSEQVLYSAQFQQSRGGGRLKQLPRRWRRRPPCLHIKWLTGSHAEFCRGYSQTQDIYRHTLFKPENPLRTASFFQLHQPNYFLYTVCLEVCLKNMLNSVWASLLPLESSRKMKTVPESCILTLLNFGWSYWHI